MAGRFKTQGLKTRHLSFLAFLFNHVLLCICFKIHFTVSKHLVSIWRYTRLIRTINKVKKSNKKFKIFHVIIILRNHYFVILKLFRAVKGFILCQIKQTSLKSGCNFTTYSRFTDTSRVEELQTQKPLSPISASSSMSRKRQSTGLEPFRQICLQLMEFFCHSKMLLSSARQTTSAMNWRTPERTLTTWRLLLACTAKRISHTQPKCSPR